MPRRCLAACPHHWSGVSLSTWARLFGAARLGMEPVTAGRPKRQSDERRPASLQQGVSDVVAGTTPRMLGRLLMVLPDGVVRVRASGPAGKS
jgi:hypothetical protein